MTTTDNSIDNLNDVTDFEHAIKQRQEVGGDLQTGTGKVITIAQISGTSPQFGSNQQMNIQESSIDEQQRSLGIESFDDSVLDE